MQNKRIKKTADGDIDMACKDGFQPPGNSGKEDIGNTKDDQLLYDTSSPGSKCINIAEFLVEITAADEEQRYVKSINTLIKDLKEGVFGNYCGLGHALKKVPQSNQCARKDFDSIDPVFSLCFHM